MKTLPPYNRPNQVGALQRFSVACSYTKQHCDDTPTQRGTQKLSLLHASFGYPQKFGSVLLLIQRLIVHIRPPQSVQTAHTAHDMHMNTDINTYTFSLNALLCPRRSELEMKRCINKTLPAVTKGPCKVTRHEYEGPGSSGYIPSSPQLAVCLSCFCPSQMGAVLHFEPVALWESSTALPVGVLVGYLRERVRSDQVPAQGPKNFGQGLSFCSWVEFSLLATSFSGMNSHNVVQLQSGIWRRVDEDVRQPVPLVRHPIWNREWRGEQSRK